jgi:hypothetical protein
VAAPINAQCLVPNPFSAAPCLRSGDLMFKFLRKYNKLILAVGGVLLMITFLVPQAIQNLSHEAGARNATLATLDNGEKMTSAEYEEAQHELQVMEKFTRGIPGLGKIEKPEHWFLLVREAERAGLVSVSSPSEMSDSQLAMLGVRDPAAFMRTQARLRGVAQMIDLFLTGNLASDRRLKATAERLLHAVNAELAVIAADPAKVEVEPTEAEISTQMNKYADVLPGAGEMGFGYKLPNRFKLEWLKITANAVRDAAKQSDAFSNVALRLHWKKNEEKQFPTVSADAPVPDVVREDLLEKLTKQKLEEIARFATDQIRLNRRALREKDGWVELPPDWNQKMLSFPALAETIRDEHKVALPTYEARGDQWLTVKDLSTLEGIGTASTDKLGNRPMTLSSLIEAAKEFGGNGIIQIQQGIAGPPLNDAEGNLYIFRITATDPSRKPQSVDEVRDTVVADLKKIAHYEQLAAAASEIERKAQTEGLLPTALAYNTTVQPSQLYLCNSYFLQQLIQAGVRTATEASPLPVIGQHRPTVETIIDRSLALPRNVAIDTLPNAERTFVVPVKDKLSLVAVRLTSAKPLSREEFAKFAEQGVAQYLLANEEFKDKDAVQDAFGFEALQKRNNFVYADDRKKANEDTSSTNAPAKTAANAGL